MLPYFDIHQDISDSVLYLARRDFLKESEKNVGSNKLGLPTSNQSDFYRLQKSGGKAVFAVACVIDFDENSNIVSHPQHFDELLKHLNLYHDIVKRAKGSVELILNKSNLKSWNEEGKITFILAVEGADSIIDETKLKAIYDLGVRSIGLTYNTKNALAGGALTNYGLSAKGKKLIKQMEELGILLDLAHISEKAFYDAIKISKKPIIVSHTACDEIKKHPRNITDEQMRAVAQLGGLIGICGVSSFVGGYELKDLVKHFIHAKKVVGIDSLALGSDFGAMLTRPLINDFEDVTDIPELFSELKKAGFTRSEVEKIAYGNVVRMLNMILPEY